MNNNLLLYDFPHSFLKGNHHEIMCVNVENAVTFHGCPMNRWKDLESLSMKLNSICPNLVRVLRAPATNKVSYTLLTFHSIK